MIHDPLCRRARITELFMEGCPECALIALVRRDEGDRYDGMAVVHWDAGHAWGLHDAKQGLRKDLWIGWAIGTLMLLIPIIVLAVTQ